jgi:hypothetical protein
MIAVHGKDAIANRPHWYRPEDRDWNNPAPGLVVRGRFSKSAAF